jgi:hypothetical protein
MNNYEIVDLIFPDTFDKAKAKVELNKKYAYKYLHSLDIQDGFLEIYAREYIKELEQIENTQPKYDREFWEKVIELNKETLNIIKWHFYINYKYVSFGFIDKIDSTPYFNFNEIELINKQYRLLQEIYYSRLEEEK